MAVVGIIAAVVAAVSAVGSAISQRKSAKETQEAEEDARAIEIRGAEIDNARRARRAVAAARIQRAEIVAGAQNANQGGNSAVSGAIGSLQTQTAANIGAANTQLAVSIAASGTRLTGANRARRFNDIAGGFSAIGTVATSVLGVTGFREPKPLNLEDFNQTKPPFRGMLP